MVVGMLLILSLPITRSSAQQDNSCWTGIIPCLETAKAQFYAPVAIQPCCPLLSAAVNNQRACFCNFKADLVSQQGDTIMNGILGTCGIPGTFGTLCPGTYIYIYTLYHTDLLWYDHACL